MNKFNLLLLTITAILFASCSHESEVTPPGAMNYPVSFSLSGEVTTRATQTGNPSNMAALDREKKVTTLHAVVYKGGVFYKVFTPSLSGSNYTFDMNQEGTFDVYLVANAATALSDQFATNAATPAMLGNLLAAQTPGDGNTADNFLMTAQKFTATTKQGTPYNGGEVKLARAAARVDVYNRVAKLAMTKLTFKNRAVQTRLTSPFTMEGIALTQDKTYESAQGLKAYELIGAMYGYENVTTGATELVLEGTYNGVSIAPKTIKLEGIPFKRNHLYSIILSEDPNAPGGGGDVPPGGDISNKLKVQIVVNDWNESTVLEFKGDDLIGGVPNFTAIAGGVPGFTSEVLNPTVINTQRRDAVGMIIRIWNTVSPPILKVVGNLPAGVTLNPLNDNTISYQLGGYERSYRLEFPTISAESDALAVYLSIENSFDNSKKREVVIFHPNRPKMAIEFIAQRNVAQDGNSFAVSNANDASGYFNWNDAVSKFTNITIDGKSYHLPSKEELAGIAPPHGPFTYPVNYNDYTTLEEIITVKGVTQMYTADYFNNINTTGICYALRFKHPTDKSQLSAWRYEYAENSAGGKILKVTCRYLGQSFTGNIKDIEEESYWQQNNSNDVVRLFPTCGVKDVNGAIGSMGLYAMYWSSFSTQNDEAWVSLLLIGLPESNSIRKIYGFPVRLFSDN